MVEMVEQHLDHVMADREVGSAHRFLPVRDDAVLGAEIGQLGLNQLQGPQQIADPQLDFFQGNGGVVAALFLLPLGLGAHDQRSMAGIVPQSRSSWGLASRRSLGPWRVFLSTWRY